MYGTNGHGHLFSEEQAAAYDAAYRAAEQMRLAAHATGRQDYSDAREHLLLAGQDYAAADGFLVELERRQRSELARFQRQIDDGRRLAV